MRISLSNHVPMVHLAVVLLSALAFAIPCIGGEIHDAVAAGNMKKVKSLLKRTPSLISSKGSDGMTALHVAVEYNRADIVEFLLASKADVNAQDDGGGAALSTAANKGFKDIANLLLANGANADAKDNVGRTALHMAALRGFEDIVDTLLARGANVNALDANGFTPLRYAVVGGKGEVGEVLRQHGGQDPEGERLMRAERARPQVIERLNMFSALILQIPSPILMGVDGFAAPGQLKIGVQSAVRDGVLDGVETVESGFPDSPYSPSTSFTFPVSSLKRIELSVASGVSHFESRRDTNGNVISSAQRATQGVTVTLLAAVGAESRDAVGSRRGRGTAVTLILMDCRPDQLQQLQMLASEINGLLSGGAVPTKTPGDKDR